MTDYFLKNFYQDVKDASWPEIQNYNDFAKLNHDIKSECFAVHKLEQRLEEIEDKHYWAVYDHFEYFRKDQFIFVNIPKCGSRHFDDFFVSTLGWKKYYPHAVSDLDNFVIFGVLMHPIDRWLKGVTEFLWQHQIADSVDLEAFAKACLFPDIHSYPLSLYFDDLYEKIHWIPFQLFSDTEVKRSMNELFKLYNSPMVIPTTHNIIHQSTPEKLELYKKIKHHWLNRNPQDLETFQATNLYTLYRFLSNDLKLYRKTVDNFDINWNHLKHKI
jgi:hypothetical protein